MKHKHKWLAIANKELGIGHAVPTTDVPEKREMQVGHELNEKCCCNPVNENGIIVHRCLIGQCDSADYQLVVN